MLTLRLNGHMEKLIKIASKKEHLNRSEFIRKCIVEYFRRNEIQKAPWILGKELFGKAGSGRSDLSTNRKSILKEKLHGKKSRY